MNAILLVFERSQSVQALDFLSPFCQVEKKKSSAFSVVDQRERMHRPELLFVEIESVVGHTIMEANMPAEYSPALKVWYLNKDNMQSFI